MIYEVEENLHVEQTLPHLTVHRSEEVERQRELEDELVHHDEVADRHRAFMKILEKAEYGRGDGRTVDDALSGEEHHPSEGRRENNVLARV